MKIGYFTHWSLPPYRFSDFLREENIPAKEIDYSFPGYLEEFDIAIIEQNAFNDYVENDELYIRDWVKRGGIFLFLHQDYCRWAPYFLPEELGHTMLIHRHIDTISNLRTTDIDDPYKNYMMPFMEGKGRLLLSGPEKITPEEMLDWRVPANTFSIVPGKTPGKSETVRSAALSCFLTDDSWEVLGSYMDPAVKKGGLVLQREYGKGMYFLNQILFPEEKTPGAESCLAFWRKYIRNLLAYLEAFKEGKQLPIPEVKRELPLKKNYKFAIHMHSLDWYGCDSSPGTIQAMMRQKGYDICSLSLKDAAPFDGKLDLDRFNDDKVLFLHGQEYHPFNFQDKTSDISHNSYHVLAMATDADAYTPEYTRSLFSDEEAFSYVAKAIAHVKKHHGAVCTAHPWNDHWKDHDFDAVDSEPLIPLAGSYIEAAFLAGKRIGILNSIDLFGYRRFQDYPAVNFLYLPKGERPSQATVVKAVEGHHSIAAFGFEECDVTLGDFIPGDEITRAEAADKVLRIYAKAETDTVEKVTIFSGKDIVAEKSFDKEEILWEFPLEGVKLKDYLRVEILADDKEYKAIQESNASERRKTHFARKMAASTPFFFKD